MIAPQTELIPLPCPPPSLNDKRRGRERVGVELGT